MAADAIALAGWPRLATVPAIVEVIDRFRAALAARNIIPPQSIIADGSIHRCDAAGKNGKGDAVATVATVPRVPPLTVARVARGLVATLVIVASLSLAAKP